MLQQKSISCDLHIVKKDYFSDPEQALSFSLSRASLSDEECKSEDKSKQNLCAYEEF